MPQPPPLLVYNSHETKSISLYPEAIYRQFKRGEAPLFKILPLIKGKGIKGMGLP